MEIKYIAGILIIAVLLLIGAGLIINDKDCIKIENTKFKIPDGYNVTDNGKVYNLTNGKDSICIEKKVGNLDINSTIDHYLKIKQKENASAKVSNLTADNILIYKVDIKNSTSCHYWFEDNGKVYSIFTVNKSINTDPLVISLINSKSEFIF